MRYDHYCSQKTYGTSEPTFSSTKGYLPSITLISKLLSIQQFDNSLLINLLTTILPMETPYLISRYYTSIAQVWLDQGEVPIMLALLERDTRGVGLAHNLGEEQGAGRPQRVGWNWAALVDCAQYVFIGLGRLVRIEISWKDRAGTAGRRSWNRESGLQVPGSLLGWEGAGSGAGRVGCLLTTDKIRCFHW